MDTSFRDWIDGIYSEPKGFWGFKVNAARAKDIINELTLRLPEFVSDSSGLRSVEGSVCEKPFKLGLMRGKEPQNPESKAGREIFKFYQAEENRSLLKGGEDSAFLTAIPSFQVPLTPDRASRLGKIDLLGMTKEGLPAVIELKCSGKQKNRSVGGLLGPILQGLAYTLTIRHYCVHSERFRKDWDNLPSSQSLPDTMHRQLTPIIVAADHGFWNCKMEWEECPWPLFMKLAEALKNEKLPLFAARFKSWKRPKLEFAPLADLPGSENGIKPLWPTESDLDTKPN